MPSTIAFTRFVFIRRTDIPEEDGNVAFIIDNLFHKGIRRTDIPEGDGNPESCGDFIAWSFVGPISLQRMRQKDLVGNVSLDDSCLSGNHEFIAGGYDMREI